MEVSHAKAAEPKYVYWKRKGYKVPGADLIKVELDKDDGMYVYEIELVKDRIAYEIKIHAKTGKVLEIDKEYIDDIYDYA